MTMATQADYDRIGNFATIYNADQKINRRNAQRTVPLEVICPGYSRTGTLSMQKALQILGYPSPYHYSSIFDNASDSDLWVEAIQAKYYGKGALPDRRFFDGLLGHVGATTDTPCILFTKELVEFYPEAKVVLVERDIDSWFVSWSKFVVNQYATTLIALCFLDPFWLGRVAATGMIGTPILAGYAPTPAAALVRSKDAYRHHYADVRAYTPKERLLEFRLEQGWEPLCKFLEKLIPNVAFPHENEAEVNKQAFVELGRKAYCVR